MRNLIAVTAAVSIVLIAARHQDSPKTEALEKRVAALESRVEKLEMKGSSNAELLLAAKVKSAKVAIKQLASALAMYEMDKGALPAQEKGLKALEEAKLVEKLAADPWGNPYNYRVPGKSKVYDLWSNGPDGREGTEDDVAAD